MNTFKVVHDMDVDKVAAIVCFKIVSSSDKQKIAKAQERGGEQECAAGACFRNHGPLEPWLFLH